MSFFKRKLFLQQEAQGKLDHKSKKKDDVMIFLGKVVLSAASLRGIA
jgi:hypothetical protein